MSVFGALDMSATGMTAQQVRSDVISQNIANVNTTRMRRETPINERWLFLRKRVFRLLKNPLVLLQDILVKV